MKGLSQTHLKLAVDYGPLAVFLLSYKLAGLQTATLALIIAAIAAVLVSYLSTRKWPPIPLATAVIVGVFGGLTLWLKDDSFIKMKPTFLYGLFAGMLGFGLLTGRNFLKMLLGEALPLDDSGWQKFSLRFMLFFIAMGAANEGVRRILDTDDWVLWKVIGGPLLTFLFIILNLLHLRRHILDGDQPAEGNKDV
jgi:intracellular septation protein